MWRPLSPNVKWYVKTLWNIFKIQIWTQTDNYNLRKNVATDKK